jgi:hypothetical protein
MFDLCSQTHESPGTRREHYVSSAPNGMDANIELPQISANSLQSFKSVIAVATVGAVPPFAS